MTVRRLTERLSCGRPASIRRVPVRAPTRTPPSPGDPKLSERSFLELGRVPSLSRVRHELDLLFSRVPVAAPASVPSTVTAPDPSLAQACPVAGRPDSLPTGLAMTRCLSRDPYTSSLRTFHWISASANHCPGRGRRVSKALPTPTQGLFRLQIREYVMTSLDSAAGVCKI